MGLSLVKVGNGMSLWPVALSLLILTNDKVSLLIGNHCIQKMVSIMIRIKIVKYTNFFWEKYNLPPVVGSNCNVVQVSN